jgi:hypothetical protein
MKKVCKIGWVMTVLLSQACHNAEKTAIKRFDRNPGFVTEIPREKDGELDYMYKYVIKEDSKLLGLDSLEYGYDSVQIRVWLGHSLAITQHIVILSSTNNKWKARLITLYRDEQVKPAKISVKDREVNPKSGWADFVKSLTGFNIYYLPHCNYDKACDECGALDGISYYFETGSKYSYRFFYYCNPDIAKGCPEAMTVLQFAAFLEKEFNFTYTK